MDASHSGEELVQTIAAWALEHGIGRNVAICEESSAPEEVRRRPLDLVLVGQHPCTVFIPAHVTALAWLTFDAGRPREIDDARRRLLVLAGRVAGSALARIRQRSALEIDREALRVRAVGSARGFLGSSRPSQDMAAKLPKLAASDATVLLLGESGVGKSFVARLLHENGARVNEPLVTINCAAIPEPLIESELFGHERGAFTGAVRTRVGACETAAGGTLFLDEIAELTMNAQAKLLRVLEARQFERVGGSKTIPLRARVIAATNRDLEAMVRQGTFRQDLFFRIAVVRHVVAPLRERVDDLEELAMRILRDLAPGRHMEGLTDAALVAMRRYTWPGNVRELRNAIEQALVFCEGTRLDVADLPLLGAATHGSRTGDSVAIPANVAWLEQQNIDAALRATGGNRTRAAALLGMNRVSLQKRLRREPGLDPTSDPD